MTSQIAAIRSAPRPDADDINVPSEPAVFKDPLTASYRIYTNDPGRELLEKLASEAGLTGLECGEPRDY